MKAILKFVGETYWPWPQDHIQETRRMGPSIRVSPESVPDIPRPYPVFFVHPRGTFTVGDMDIEDLLTELFLELHIPSEADRDDYIQNGLPTLALIDIFHRLDEGYEVDKVEFERLEKKYKIEFHYAVTHYSYITSTQVVVGDDGEGLDLVDLMEGKGIEVEPVKVIREDA